MDYYHKVSILGVFIKDEEFLDQLSDFQLIKEVCFMEAVFRRIRNYEFYISPIIFFVSVRLSANACDKQLEGCACFLTPADGTNRLS
jgi:hypothetical protein